MPFRKQRGRLMTLKDSILLASQVGDSYQKNGIPLTLVAVQKSLRTINQKEDIEIYELQGMIYYRISGAIFELIAPKSQMDKYFRRFMNPNKEDKKWLKRNAYKLI